MIGVGDGDGGGQGGHFPPTFLAKYFSGKGHQFFRQEVLNQYFLPEKSKTV
jgi:hypothetical protein